ncbi:retinol dehydrogenase 12-like [Venturia canescens]|uniref:retinol dehydrogenase 12-like n=1 Tax=Venturia canescens TaxID=32260 RepID=UPI001C9C11F6|nr:retinol dehydrogenase 12-like [Venturia canescens]
MLMNGWNSLVYVFAPLLFIFGLVRKCRERTWGTCRGSSNLQGRVYLVTGANSGIGKETVRELVKRNARVIMACRNIDSARSVMSEIRRKTTTGEMIPMKLDLACLGSIREFAESVLRDFPKIDALINNAGVYVPMKDKAVTSDGFEIHFGVNHLGHFLLTNLLLERLGKSAPSRIVVVTSKLLESGTIDFDNLNGESKIPTKGRMNPCYCNSKLANAYFAMELSRRLQNSGICVYSVCPGFTYTGLFRYVKRSWFHYVVFSPFALLFLRTAHQGAQTVLCCATDPSLSGESGLLYRDCKVYKPKIELSPEIGLRLWEVSAKLVGLNEKPRRQDHSLMIDE